MWVAVPEQYTFLSVAAVRYFLSSPVLVTIWGDFGILECPHGPFRRNEACFFLYAPVLANAWGDFGILECPHGPFRRNAACFFLYAPVLAIIWGDFGISEYPHGPFRRKQKGGQSGCNASRGLLMHGQHRPVNPVRVCRDMLYTHGAACIQRLCRLRGPAGAAPALFVNTV